ncbi:LysM peptidoglycan-binding and 3D domain-containing protein [Bacillus sp. FJAT-22090]|uniref:LysM peptidoglycan-binding and 3D domain-containing protein n=1 Tax=Bacillus sp. FJAT-22090 TaxID=1581038 RepID=UPI0011A55BDE|nr:3D domain-containing protein [Bacillus sp. FJAT-22090]
MKKHIIALTAIATFSVGATSHAFASTIHTVEKGDSLWSIANEMKVSVQDLQEWNNLDSTVIYPSQQLKIEELLETYKVVTGDTLFEIAQENNLSVDELMKNNQLTSDLIFPGDELVLKGKKTVQPKVSAATTTSVQQSKSPVTQPTSVANKEFTVSSTAYTASCEGCSGITSTGIDLRANPTKKVISVDPSIIPLGSRVWVEGYGEAIAGDTGGSIKGKKIDIFMATKQEAVNWGQKNVHIKILD